MKINHINKVLLIVVFVAFAFQTKAQEWTVPAEDHNVTCSKPFTKTTARDGKDLFNTKCKSCHGGAGENASLPLNPEPGDVAADKFSKQTDGDLFYKLTNGKGGMPGFASQMSEEERWNVISYIRTFHKNYVAVASEGAIVEETESFSGNNIKLFVSFDQVNLEVTTNVQGEVNGIAKAASGVRVGFFVKRNFGMLPIGNVVTTDANGVAKVKFPSDLPGDSVGNFDVVIKLIDEDLYGKVEFKETISWGEAFVYENPLDHRAMWGDRGNAPMWLMITYFAVVGFVWAVIMWVVFQVVKLKKLV